MAYFRTLISRRNCLCLALLSTLLLSANISANSEKHCRSLKDHLEGLLENFESNRSATTALCIIIAAFWIPWPSNNQLVVLFISADPRNVHRLRLGEEQRSLELSLRCSIQRDLYKLETLSSCQPQDLGPALRYHKPTVIHFSGHGSSDGLCFEDEAGDVQKVDIEKLAKVLKQAKNLGLQCVFMNACYSEAQARAIANNVPYVIAMEGAFSDDAAIQFTKAFYRALGDGCAFDGAYNWALAETGLNDASGPLKPHLIRARG